MRRDPKTLLLSGLVTDRIHAGVRFQSCSGGEFLILLKLSHVDS